MGQGDRKIKLGPISMWSFKSPLICGPTLDPSFQPIRISANPWKSIRMDHKVGRSGWYGVALIPLIVALIALVVNVYPKAWNIHRHRQSIKSHKKIENRHKDLCSSARLPTSTEKKLDFPWEAHVVPRHPWEKELSPLLFRGEDYKLHQYIIYTFLCPHEPHT